MPLAREGSGNVERIVRRYAFGLDIVSARTFEAASKVHSHEGEPSTTIDAVEPDVIDREWPREGGECLVDKRLPSGEPFLTIDRHPDRGFRVASPGYGSYLISTDGSRVLASVPRESGWRWQRLLFAQVLPLASALQGFALFHASGVAMEGRGYGFVAASGTGKTSVAAHLVAAGAAFLTDDVMALSVDSERVWIHPGPGMIAIDPDELGRVAPRGGASLGDVMGRSDKTHLARRPLGSAVPLAALYYLDRGASEASFSISRRSPDPLFLLGSGFLTYLNADPHLQRHLEACAQIARSVPVFSVRVPPSFPAREVAARIGEHLGAPQQDAIG